MRFFLLAWLVSGIVVADTNSAAFSQAAVAPVAELVLSGPSSMPLFRKGQGVKFQAKLVNRSKSPVTLVRPPKNWFDERSPIDWEARDAKNRPLGHLPTYQMECLPLPSCPSVAESPIQIRDEDVLVLQPAESYEIAGLLDPSFSLKFPNRGVYRVSLIFRFEPQRYELPKDSRYAEALKTASVIEVSSNQLKLAVN